MNTEIKVEQADDEGLYDLVDELTEEGNEITKSKLVRVKRWFAKSGIAQCRVMFFLEPHWRPSSASKDSEK